MLADDILATHFTLSSAPGAIDLVKYEGIDGWSSTNAHPVLSLMRWVTDDISVAEKSLDLVVSDFKNKGRGFDWMTGPRCDENCLTPLLAERGFVNPPLAVAAMVKTIDSETEPVEGVHVWQANRQQHQRCWEVMAKGFDVPDDVCEIFHNAYMTASSKQNSVLYAASSDDEEMPMGVGYSSFIGDGSTVLLRVSATLDEYRGRGIYRSLVARRLNDALKAGATRVVVHAYSQQSQSILEKMGFVNAGSLHLNRWRP